MDCNGNVALVIVDMQPGFEAARSPSTIAAVMNAIAEAKNVGAPIFALELHPGWYQSTIGEIAAEIDNYDGGHFIEKRYNDGSSVLMREMESDALGLEIDHMYVCGVNSCYCVQETVHSLCQRYDKQVTVIESACNCQCALGEHHSLSMEEHGERTYLDTFQHENCIILEREVTCLD